MNRRHFLKCAGALALAPAALHAAAPKRKLKLGLVTYNVAAQWDLATIIENCRQAKIEGVEFRTTHKHGVEPSLTAEQRRDVKKRCADGGLAIVGLGSVCEFHSADPAVVKKHIADCADFVKLAADIGARGVKVRPNGLVKNVPEEKTLAQIGAALVECGKVAADHGVEIWLEVHGKDTQEPTRIRAIMDACPNRSVGVCWNSNAPDVKDGSVKWSFDLLKDRLLSCHINDLNNPKYPYQELFALMRRHGYDRYTLCEHGKTVPAEEGVAFLKQYRQRWLELAGA
ncbi:MAG: sugar phosphate isomerase/epimerase [Verrucomicrobia bacterium]|nr:sugar phosphate isomerase/epimerase [Verrucomicrobiota bacterium]